MPTANISIYDEVVRVTRVYLGPTADRFIARQVQHHLRKPPEDLTAADLRALAKWMRISISMLTDDTDIIDEYMKQLEKLTKKGLK